MQIHGAKLKRIERLINMAVQPLLIASLVLQKLQPTNEDAALLLADLPHKMHEMLKFPPGQKTIINIE